MQRFKAGQEVRIVPNGKIWIYVGLLNGEALIKARGMDNSTAFPVLLSLVLPR